MAVPKLRFKEFKDDYISTNINDITEITMGQSPNSVNYTSNRNDIILIQGNADLNNGKIQPRLYTTEITKMCEINDIIMTVRAPVGDLAITEYKACIGRGVCSIKGSKYLYYYLENFKYKGEWKKLSKGSTIDSITSNDLKNINITLPDKFEQEKIANFLSLLDKKIELQQKKIEALKIYKIGLIKKIFGDMKDNDSIRLKDLYHFAYGEGNTNPDNGGIYPVYGANGKIGGFNKYNAEYSVIIGHMGAYAGNVLFEENKHFVTYNGTIAIPKDIKILRPKFGYYMLLNTNLPKICAGSGMPFLSYEILNNIKVKLPDIKAQEKCEKILDKTEAKIKLEKIKFKNLRQLKKSLLQQMFI